MGEENFCFPRANTNVVFSILKKKIDLLAPYRFLILTLNPELVNV